MSFNKNIKKLRMEKGWTQVQLSQKLGVTAKTISFYETGDREPSREMLIKLAEIFNVSVDKLIRKDVPISNKERQISKEAMINDIKQILTDIGAFEENASLSQEEYDEWLRFMRAQVMAFREFNKNRP